MNRNALLGFFVSVPLACTGLQDGSTSSAALTQCGAGQTVLYIKVTPPSAGEDGASGIANAPAVLGGSGQQDSGDADAASASTTPFASTTTSCVPEVCPAGQVAVPRLSASSGYAGGEGAAVSPPAGSSPSGRSSTGTSTPPTLRAGEAPPSTISASEVICTAPPPACAAGEAPSYAPAGFWHCMPVCDPNNANLVVISYGGIYGGGGVCAGLPPQHACATAGQVWTWNFENEAWACAAECNNGQYDRHAYGNQIVCVPC